MITCTEVTKGKHDDDSDVFPGIGCFKGIFSLQVKMVQNHTKPLSLHMAYALQELYMKDLEYLQHQQIIVTLGVDETLE